MEVRISVEKEFDRQLRKLTKKYRSIIDDYETFLNELEKDPYQGSSLGRGVRKVRMAIASKVKVKVVEQGLSLTTFTKKRMLL